MKKKILALILCLSMVFALALPTFAEEAKGFSDIKAGDTFYDEVMWCADKGYMAGYADGSFGVAKDLTRAQVCLIFYRIAGEPTGAKAAKFADDADIWCKDAVNWASEKGVMGGYKDGSFKPNNSITREEFVTVFYRFLEKPAYTGDKLASFPDASAVKGSFKEAMGWAVENGIIGGYANGKIGPQGLLSRGAMAAILYRYYNEEPAPTPTPVQYVTRNDWADDVKAAINDFIAMYGKDSENYDPNSYVVFDFDDTCAIYDVAVIERYHRLQTMQFSFTPEQSRDVLKSGFGDPTVLRNDTYSVTGKAGTKHCYNDWIDDIEAAYAYLWEKFGPFDYKGVTDEAVLAEMHKDPMWKEFAVKMQVMFKFANANEGDFLTYPWYKYWNTGMTEEEVHYVATSAYTKYSSVPSTPVTWKTELEDTKVGIVETSWTEGISVSANIVELYKALHDNGINVWVVSASGTDQVRAAVDYFGLHDYTTGVVAYTAKVGADGKIVNQYDYESGVAWYTDGNGWKKGNITMFATPNAVGKTAAINNALCSQYGCGPLAAFGDSAGDYEMVTMYDSLKLVMFLNVGKKFNNAGLLYNVALYQKDVLKYDLAKANAAGDTLYVIQGRDENGMRCFINSNASVGLNGTEAKYFANADAETFQAYLEAHPALTTKQIIDTYTMKTAVDAEGNDTGLAYGFRTFYGGYHSLHY